MVSFSINSVESGSPIGPRKKESGLAIMGIKISALRSFEGEKEKVRDERKNLDQIAE
jgi:hypothetical protein